MAPEPPRTSPEPPRGGSLAAQLFRAFPCPEPPEPPLFSEGTEKGERAALPPSSYRGLTRFAPVRGVRPPENPAAACGYAEPPPSPRGGFASRRERVHHPNPKEDKR